MAKLIDIDNLSRFWENAKDYIDSRIDSRVGGAVYDNVMITYHSDAIYYHVKVDDWPALQAAGEMADGVLIVEGGRQLIVAPEGVTGNWAATSGNQGGTVLTDMYDATQDFDGKGNTAAYMEHEECQGEQYAVGYCAAYSRLNAQGTGYGAGEWWLPSLGELELIYAHWNAVLHALSLIDGAVTALGSNYLWSSTKCSDSIIWRIGQASGQIGRMGITAREYGIRPVTRPKYN